MLFKQRVLIESKDHVEPVEEGAYHVRSIGLWLERPQHKRITHFVEHTHERRCERVQASLVVRRFVHIVYMLQVGQRVLESAAVFLATPQQRSQMNINLRATKKVLEGFIGEPTAPIATETCTGE